MSISDESLRFHEKLRGKLSVQPKVPVRNHDDLSLVYTPGVAAACEAIARDPQSLYAYTMKSNTIAVVTDGSAVMGLGNIGAEASLPVMEGKCLLFKQFADIDAFPLCVSTQNIDEFVETVKRVIAPFGGVNLEDVGAPHCFDIEERLKHELDVPVFHDDQHGTATVVLAALINALKVTGRSFEEVKIVISGAGAAGSAITKLLHHYGAREIFVCDRHGLLTSARQDLQHNSHKLDIARITNPGKQEGTLSDVLKGADVFIGVSGPRLLDKAMVEQMSDGAIVFALANPTPEIMPQEATEGGARIVGTGRSDFPNQINNVLAFPGIFRGVLDAKIREITPDMLISCAEALARHVKNPVPEKVIPDIFDDGVCSAVAEAIKRFAS